MAHTDVSSPIVYQRLEECALGSDTIKRASLPVDDPEQARARRALDWRRHDQAVDVLPEHRSKRIADCRQYATLGALEAGHGAVMMRGGDGVCRWSHVARCKNAWLCAVCMRYDSGERRRQLQACVDAWVGRAGGFMMVTYTTAHSAGDLPRELVDRFALAQRRLCASGSYKRLLERLGVRHQVKATEYTWGPVNGAHPHRHCLLLLDAPAQASPAVLDAARSVLLSDVRYRPEHVLALEPLDLVQVALRVELGRLWWMACCSELREPKTGRVYPPLLAPFDMEQARTFALRGVDVAIGFGDVQDYIDKHGHEPRWSLAAELTSGRTKRGGRAARAGVRFTPLQLLDAMDDEQCPVSPADLAEQFRRYALAMHDRNPVQGLGALCKALGVDDADRHDLAAPGEVVELVTTVPETVAIRRARAWRQLLLVAERLGLAAVRSRLDLLCREHLEASTVLLGLDGRWHYRADQVEVSRLVPGGDPYAYPGQRWEPLPEPEDCAPWELSWVAPIGVSPDPYRAAMARGDVGALDAFF